jgi:hypothetical protein
MSKEVHEDSNHAPFGETHSSKLPYQKPAFRYEGVFETMALACGKINATQSQCRNVTKLS